MNLVLKNTDFIDAGIFGELLDENGKFLFYTLQHAYETTSGSMKYEPKVIEGTYTCKRGMHQLAHMTFPFETFEITNVPNHINILFHVGNYNDDSSGCVLLGAGRSMNSRTPMISQSNKAFNAFLNLQKGVDTFTLVVTNK
jgi:hypothetical protein